MNRPDFRRSGRVSIGLPAAAHIPLQGGMS